jgi:hypothetical protein
LVTSIPARVRRKEYRISRFLISKCFEATFCQSSGFLQYRYMIHSFV